tara:strand:+ start:67 stop:231 length:165 start_codon:yes stop_codon:yes gene_type:complete
MPHHTDLVFVYELTKQALENIKDLERKMKKHKNKKTTRKKYSKKNTKTRKKYNI